MIINQKSMRSDMIRIDQGKCTACGLCVKICHEYCLHLEDDQLVLDPVYCSTCTQCVAVCPEQAITWGHHPPEKFDRSLYPTPEQVAELFRQRRTNRNYTRKPVERQLLEEIAGYAVYAPTHNFDLRVRIIDDKALIGLVDTLIYRSCKRMNFWIYRTGIPYSLAKMNRSWEFEMLKAKPKIEHAVERKSGFKSTPTAMILVTGSKSIPLSKESAQYALYNMDLYAQSKGLASRNLVGNQGLLNRSREFRKAAGIGKHERIYGTMTLGHPAVKFRNKVTGKHLPVHWNGSRG
jgi:NAD-dependent dihydropyrimidine dehydrogenase PreA subunit/nitroreductase